MARYCQSHDLKERNADEGEPETATYHCRGGIDENAQVSTSFKRFTANTLDRLVRRRRREVTDGSHHQSSGCLMICPRNICSKV